MHSLGRAALAAMMIVGAGTANAQITTVVAAPPAKLLKSLKTETPPLNRTFAWAHAPRE